MVEGLYNKKIIKKQYTQATIYYLKKTMLLVMVFSFCINDSSFIITF